MTINTYVILVDNVDNDRGSGTQVPAVIFLGSNDEDVLGRILVVQGLGGKELSSHGIDAELVKRALFDVVGDFGCSCVGVDCLW